MFKALIGGGGRAFKAIGRKLNQPKVVKMEDYITDPDMLNDLKNPDRIQIKYHGINWRDEHNTECGIDIAGSI